MGLEKDEPKRNKNSIPKEKELLKKKSPKILIPNKV